MNQTLKKINEESLIYANKCVKDSLKKKNKKAEIIILSNSKKKCSEFSNNLREFKKRSQGSAPGSFHSLDHFQSRKFLSLLLL